MDELKGKRDAKKKNFPDILRSLWTEWPLVGPGKGQGQLLPFSRGGRVRIRKRYVRIIVEGCAELGIGYLTLYAVSTEILGRPALMRSTGDGILLVETIRKEVGILKQETIYAACYW